MQYPKKQVYLLRHGETEWSISGQHTGNTDISLTPNGRKQATLLGERLKSHDFKEIFTSPLKRAYETCELAGLLKKAKIEPDLKEWDYGDYEGLTTNQIHKQSPDWNLFSHGAPGGESLVDISARATKILFKIKSCHGDVAIISHGHFLRILAAKWLELSSSEGKHLALFPASLSILGFERDTPALELWNDISHLKF